MNFKEIQEKRKLLEEALRQSKTQEAVSKLKKDISQIIIEFNKLNKSDTSLDHDQMLELQKSIAALKDNYLKKIKELKAFAANTKKQKTETEPKPFVSMPNPLDPTGKSQLKFHIGTIDEMVGKFPAPNREPITFMGGSVELFEKFMLKRQENGGIIKP